MQRLFQFLFKYRTFISLIILEGFCFWIIVNFNNYQGAKYFTSSNNAVASITASTDQIGDYFNLTVQNKRLAEENAKLRQQLLDLTDSSFMSYILTDSTQRGIKAKVIDNSLFYRNNFLTINKGSLHGIAPGMGVIGPEGIVGQVYHATKNYATVISLLHSKSMISAHHKMTGTLCSVEWTGEDPRFAALKYLPRHIKIQQGDTITTSGFNAVFPENQLIGTVKNVQLDDDATFYDIEIALTTNFFSLSHVYLLQLRGREEKDSLNNIIIKQYDEN
jgi:rod shape-determining protein MreC